MNPIKNQGDLLSLASKSKEGFLREYKKNYEENAQELYLQLLKEVKKTVSVGNLDNFKLFIKLIDYIETIEDSVTLQSYYNSIGNPLKNTNLVVLTCKYNKIKILQYIFNNSDGKFLNGLFQNEQNLDSHSLILPIDEDEECHNAFYYAISSNSIQLIETLIDKWPNNYLVNNTELLDEILSKAYEELKLKNVELSDKMEVFVENKLINIRFFDKNPGPYQRNKITWAQIKERIDLVITNINLLKYEYLSVDVDERFFLMAKFIAQNIHILKRQLKSTYNSLPWEEIEFCLIAYTSSKMRGQKIDKIHNPVLTKTKILDHLENFANSLNNETLNLDKSNKLNELPKLKREFIVAEIIRKNPLFKQLYNDYKQIRDINSLQTINSYIKLALSANYKKKEGQIVITRALQVIGEYLKNTLESPKLSNATSELLLYTLPKNTREVITDLRNSLSHSISLSKRTEFEENTNVNFFSNVQNDIKKISVVIVDVLYRNKIEMIATLLNDFISAEDSDKSDELKEIVAAFDDVRFNKTGSENVKIKECETIEKLVQELSNQIIDKTIYESDLLDQIINSINCEKTKIENIKSDHYVGLVTLKGLIENMSHIKADDNVIRVKKAMAYKALQNISPKINVDGYKNIPDLILKVFKNVVSRTNFEICDNIMRPVSEICHIMNFELSNVKWIEELRDKLNTSEQNLLQETKAPDNQLPSKLSTLQDILSNNSLDNHLIEKFPSYKTNRKLQAAIEMLVLDIMSILDSSKHYLSDNVLLFDNDSPLLVGKNLRNHLAHGNALLNILLFEPCTAFLLNARKLTTENVLESGRRIGKLIQNDPLKLKSKYHQDLKTISNQQQLFNSLAEGNLENVKNCLSKGADIKARNVNMWTALHFAAKGPSLEAVKFVLKHNVNINAKDVDGQKALHIATFNRRKNILEYLIEERNVAVDDVDRLSKTPLQIAAQNGYKDIVKVLLRNKASVTYKDPSGWAALHYAVRNGHEDVAKLLLEKEKTVDSNETMGGFTALHLAADGGYLEITNYLIKNKANVNAKSDLHGIPLHAASLNGNAEVVKTLLQNGSKINAQTRDGSTSLHYAVERGYKEVVQILLENGANVNAIDKVHNCSPLNYAAQNNREAIVEVLLQNKAYIDNKNMDGMTPLLSAAHSGYLNIVRTLINNQAGIEYKNNYGFTPLFMSALYGHYDVAYFLIEQGADINTTCNAGRTPLHAAAQNGYNQVVEILIAKGADIDYVDNEGYTALHISCLQGHKDVIETLIRNGVTMNTCSKTNKTPLHHAVTGGSADVVKMLLEHGANLNLLDSNGMAPLHIAAAMGNKEVVEILIAANADVDIKAHLVQTTPLHLAVFGNHIDIAKILIGTGCDINCKDTLGHTPLSYVIKNNFKALTCYLLKEGADINVSGGAPLSTAVFCGFKDIVEMLLADTRIKVDVKDSDNATLLHIAALHGHKHLIGLLLATGVDINAKTTTGITPLYYAIIKGNYEVVKILIENKADIMAVADDGLIPIHLAAQEGYDKIVELFLNSGVAASVLDGKGRTCLEIAVTSGHLEVVKTLLQNKRININAIGIDDFTVLHKAAQGGYVEMVNYLINKGANINAFNALGSKAIHVAASEGHVKVLQYFLDSCNMPLDDIGLNGWTLLHYAATGSQIEIAKYLIERGIDVNTKDHRGFTPLHIAVAADSKHVVQLLLTNGAVYNSTVDGLSTKPIDLAKNFSSNGVRKYLTLIDKLFGAVKENNVTDVEKLINEGASLNAKSSDNVTPLHYATWKGYTKIVDILIKQEANPNAVGKGGCTPLHYASKFSHFDIVKTLLGHGAIYNVVTDAGKTPKDFAQNKAIINLFKLVYDSFLHVQKGNSKVISDLKKLKDVKVVKAVMNARNDTNKTLVVVATDYNFPKVKELKEISQDDLSLNLPIAELLIAQEKFPEALEVYREVFERRKELLGPDNPATLDIEVEMGKMLYKLLKYQEALNIYREVYEKQKKILGSNHKNTLNTQSCMALVLHRQGKDEEALSIYEEILPKQKQLLGADHSDTLVTQSHITLVLGNLHRYQEALDINCEMYEKRKRTLGPNHPVTLTCQNNVALFLHLLGKNDESLKIYKKVYPARKKALGAFHSDTMRTLHNMIKVLSTQKKHEEALKTYREVLETQKSVLGANHLDTLNTQSSIGQLLLTQGKYLGALKIFTETLEPKIAILGPNHPDILNTRKMIDTIQFSYNKFQGEDTFGVMQCIQEDITVAAANGDIKTVQDLIDNGIDVNTRDGDSRTPLHYAASKGYKDIIEILLKNGADATQSTIKGNTPLHMAASKGFNDIVEILLQFVKQTKCDQLNGFVNAKTSNAGTAALHVATNLEMAILLLKYGAMYDIRNNAGKTPLDCNQNGKVSEILTLTDELFQDAKKGSSNVCIKLQMVTRAELMAVTKARNSYGNTLLQVAMVNKHKDIVSKLLQILKDANDV